MRRRMRVLLILEEAELYRQTQDLLHRAGHEIVDQLEALRSCGPQHIDMAIVDTNIVPALRTIDASLPVLALSGGSVDERVRALYDGADDCLDAPYAQSQMAARVHALGRRAARPPAPQHTIEHEDLTIDLDRALAIRGPTRFNLTARELSLVRYLHEHRPRAVPRAELLANVWKVAPTVHTRAVDVAISALRRKLEHDPRAPRVIRSIVGVGYAWAD